MSRWRCSRSISAGKYRLPQSDHRSLGWISRDSHAALNSAAANARNAVVSSATLRISENSATGAKLGNVAVGHVNARHRRTFVRPRRSQERDITRAVDNACAEGGAYQQDRGDCRGPVGCNGRQQQTDCGPRIPGDQHSRAPAVRTSRPQSATKNNVEVPSESVAAAADGDHPQAMEKIGA